MKQETNHFYWIKRASAVFSIFLVTCTLLLSSFRTQKMTDDIWKALGISKQSGDDKIQNSFRYGYLYHYGVRNAKNLAVNDRAAIARDLMNYTKTYVSGPVFKKYYEDLRKTSKPSEPVLKPLRTIEEIQKEEIAKTEKSIKDLEKSMKEMPQYAKSFEPTLEMQKKMLKEYQNPKHQTFAYIAQGEKYQQEGEIKRFEENMKNWEKNYPANINDFIAERLQKMLDNTKDIDYNAELVEKWEKKRFVKPEYERKNQEWKQGFRAGKEVTEAARAFAQKWLNELKGKA